MNNASSLIPDLPFCLGAMPTPENPGGIPNVHPFRLELNYALGRLEQAVDPILEDLLERAYRVGNEMGTPSDNTELGRPYVDDFMRFISQSTLRQGRLLEIGAGTGFMSKCLSQAGWQVTSIEPGLGYQKYWDFHGVEVVNDFFPSSQVAGEFDAQNVVESWEPHGWLAAVPDDLLDVLVVQEQWLAERDGRVPRSRDELATLIDTSVYEEAVALGERD